MARSWLIPSLVALAAATSLGCVERRVETTRANGATVVEEETRLASPVVPATPENPAPVDPPGPDRDTGIHIEGPRRTIDIDAGPNGAKIDVDPKTPAETAP
ncbi:MAG TPA: hypothetical protein VGE52_12100 [Pirellulales bacterium]